MSALKIAIAEAQTNRAELEHQMSLAAASIAAYNKVAQVFEAHVRDTINHFVKTGFGPGSDGSLWNDGLQVARIIVCKVEGEPCIYWEVYGFLEPTKGYAKYIEEFGKAMARWLV